MWFNAAPLKPILSGPSFNFISNPFICISRGTALYFSVVTHEIKLSSTPISKKSVWRCLIGDE